MNRKDVIFSVLTTFCLCALIFSVLPIRGSQPYDPWADLDDNGKISMADIGFMCQMFGTYGNPTKNVTVFSMPYEIQSGTITATQNGVSTVYITCNGYSRLSVLLAATNVYLGGAPNKVLVSVQAIRWLASLSTTTGSYQTVSGCTMTVDALGSWTGPQSFTTETKAPYCQLAFSCQTQFGNIIPESWHVTFDWNIYLRNE